MSSSAISANELLLVLGAMGVVGIIGGWFSEKLKVPDVVIYLLLGILAGPLFFNIIDVESFPVVNEIILSFGSAFVLYEGGREIKLRVLNQIKITVGLLATLGVFISMVVVAIGMVFVFKLPFSICLLMGAIIASTDPASLIPIFNQVAIRNKLKQTIISESAFNDATGAILVTSLLATILTGSFTPTKSLIQLIMMAGVGIVVGAVVSLTGEALSSDKQYGIFREFGPIISVLTVIFAYELAERLHGSGYMAVFIAGLISGNKKQFGLWAPEENFVSAVHFRENISTLSRMAIFLVLGTHVDMQALLKYGLKSFIIVLVLMFIARPLVVLICALPDKKAQWKKREIFFMMWVRETGVIPAALSGLVVSMRITGYEIISSVVFMTLLITLLLQASTTKWMAKKLKVLETPST
ncbi:sodium:proton antiporter [Sporanaerobium hydrogeniformans]|uniref:Sodium:proton antiporter n=1 Tax=Sporanaerobium hydrogeniformans TaxID=3072179 RepID=A0AC61DGK3_9FIRM|nr:cation:proton antiporter [Sporanaerobium hydrogeniformans]PHV72464.1 sodium:proton antiporter [Sporanaerobium hydrogeniformans]